MNLYKFQEEALERTKDRNRVAFYHEMGLGKTFTGAEKMMRLGKKANLVVCQKSKVDDWLNHFNDNYCACVYNLRNADQFDIFMRNVNYTGAFQPTIGVINYDLLIRRPELKKLFNFTLMLDESSLIQNEKAKRSKHILRELHPSNVILLSGTPCSGKYEALWSQMRLLGWDISRNAYWNTYVDYKVDTSQGFPLVIVKGYKNVERLKEKMREYGCDFIKTDEVFDLPDQIDTEIKVATSSEYRHFRKERICEVEGKELVGDTTLTKMLYERMLCGQYNHLKLQAIEDLLESTEDRLVIFYSFNDELHKLEDICHKLDKPVSIINGFERDLTNYNEYGNSVTLIQYQAGAMGLNLQKANKIIYFTPPLSSELYEQSKKRIHRIGQKSNCFYYRLICKNSIEERIYRTLAMRKDYTERLFEKEER